MKTSYLILLLLLSCAAPAFAQSAQSAAGLEQAANAGTDIVVTANRTATPIDRVGQSVTVIDTATIEQRQAATVSDLLLQTPGVTVARNGGVGTTTALSIRGAETDQTVALIDGVKLNDPASPGGGFNFGTLLIGNIARIEVLRGAQSVLWGNQAIGGVVNLITRQPSDHLEINARAEGGWHDTGQGFANISDKIGPVSASFGAGYYRTDSNSAYFAGKERDGYRDFGANGSVNIALAKDLSVDLRGFYSNGRTDFDGFPPPNYVFADDREYELAKQIVGYAGLNAGLFDGRFHNRFSYAYTDTRRRDFNPDSSPTETFDGNGFNYRMEYQGVVDLGDALQTTFGAEREVTRFTTSSPGGPVTFGRARIFSVYGQAVVTPFTGLSLTGGVRHDDHNVFGGATTFSGSGAYSPNGGSTVFRGSYSEGFKAPTVYQLQSQYGNSSLVPERSHGWDAGVTQHALDGAIEASATWFHRNSDNLINFISCPTPLPLTGICAKRPNGTYTNVSKALSQGLEVALTLKPTPAFTLVGSYTYLDAENRTPGASFDKRLTRRPSQSVTVNADYRWSFGLETGATVSDIGDSYNNASNSQRLKGYVLAGVRASFPVTRNIAVYGRVDNLFNEIYQTIYQYGVPGRAAYGGVRLRY
ncbi:TonB-dependent receptor plug domain-containing protein [uncultured Sphingomonas sp.]|uniref:TonB-dependent receptor plug domain-containing protein n=1 Tax=uncultured Sphingomonas sp. TaxID=158754 RepID=UPI0035CA0C76